MRPLLLALVALLASAGVARAELLAAPQGDWKKAIRTARRTNKPLLVYYQMIMM